MEIGVWVGMRKRKLLGGVLYSIGLWPQVSSDVETQMREREQETRKSFVWSAFTRRIPGAISICDNI